MIVHFEVGFTSILKINLEMTGEYDARVVKTSSQVIATALDIRPDIIILADDLGFPDLGCYGGEIDTPPPRPQMTTDHPFSGNLPFLTPKQERVKG